MSKQPKVKKPCMQHVADLTSRSSYLTEVGVIDVYACSKCGKKFTKKPF